MELVLSRLFQGVFCSLIGDFRRPTTDYKVELRHSWQKQFRTKLAYYYVAETIIQGFLLNSKNTSLKKCIASVKSRFLPGSQERNEKQFL